MLLNKYEGFYKWKSELKLYDRECVKGNKYRLTWWKISSQWWSKTGSYSLSKEYLFKPCGETKYKVQMLKKKERNLVNLDYKANCLETHRLLNLKGTFMLTLLHLCKPPASERMQISKLMTKAHVTLCQFILFTKSFAQKRKQNFFSASYFSCCNWTIQRESKSQEITNILR